MRVYSLVVGIFICINILSQDFSSKDYIQMYKDLAIKEMKRTGIPASITLAQGMLESGNGNSKLAVKANNHFGIKCHNWDGGKIYHDDDKRGECFRKYKSAYESYIDHSDFLVNTSRYDELFELNPTDYKSWAKGLKKAGYATAHDYDRKLVRIIEENKLYIYDEGSKATKPFREEQVSENVYSESGSHEIKLRNNIKYIVAKEGDSYESLTGEFNLFKWQLSKYNELDQGYKINPGDIVYMQPKRKKAEFGNKFHIVKSGETMYEISQKYGVKLNELYKKNLMLENEEPKPEEKIWLRRTKNGERPVPIKETKEKTKKPKRDRQPKNNKEEDIKNSNTLEFDFD